MNDDDDNDNDTDADASKRIVHAHKIDTITQDVKVVFSKEAQGLSRGLRLPAWNSETMLTDYLPKAQAAVAKPWSARKSLVATLAVRYSVLEYDAQDFTTCQLLMKVGMIRITTYFSDCQMIQFQFYFLFFVFSHYCGCF